MAYDDRPAKARGSYTGNEDEPAIMAAAIPPKAAPSNAGSTDAGQPRPPHLLEEAQMCTAAPWVHDMHHLMRVVLV